MKTKYFERFTLSLPIECIDECSRSGPVDLYVEKWQKELDLSHISDQKLREELREYGAWSDDELQDRITNEQRIIWCAACDIDEEALINEN